MYRDHAAHADAAGSHTDARAGDPPFVGADGFAMLALSCLVLLASGGLTLLGAWLHVLRVALATPCEGLALIPATSRAGRHARRTSGAAARETDALSAARHACQRPMAQAGGLNSILVLGYRLMADGRPAALYRQRLDRAHLLLATFPQAHVFLLGGITHPGLPSEAEVGAAYLQTRGVPADWLHQENRSRHTLENLRHYRVSFPAEPDAHAVLVTSRFHIARAALMADGLGLRCRMCAAEAGWRPVLCRPGRLIMEAFLVHWYVVGRSFSHWTGNARMLARIS